MEPIFFPDAAALRDWFARHAAHERELLAGFHKRGTGRPSPTWSEAVDEALSVGWIDGVTRRIDDGRYVIRFTPRRPRSVWSAVNVKKVAALTAEGRMTEAGLAAFAARREEATGVYAFEQEHVAFTPEQRAGLEAHPEASAFFAAQPPWYRRAATWWVVSAKREETRRRRLAALIDDSAAGRTLPHLTRRTAGGR